MNTGPRIPRRAHALLPQTPSDPYEAGYVDGYRSARWHLVFLGFLLGMSFVAASVQLGYWVGGMP